MTLSVIIVNYNVKYFLEQCLESVYHSQLTYGGGADRMAGPDGGDTVAIADGGMKAFELEVFVVDNASVDGSVEMVRRKYPLKLILSASLPTTTTPDLPKPTTRPYASAKAT